MSLTLTPGFRKGVIAAPPSKSHAHRLLIASFLSGDRSRLAPEAGDSADIRATKRCLAALATDEPKPVLDCGESGSTLRFLAPVAAALGKRPAYVRRGRLAERPFRAYETLGAGLHELPGDVSSQFVTGLLFALPLLKGDSTIRLVSPLESRGYVDMTVRVLRDAGIRIDERADGYGIPGNQTYRLSASRAVEGDWSGAAFWLAMRTLGSDVSVTGLDEASAQPDRAVVAMLRRLETGTDPVSLDVSQCPDIFPVLSVVAAAMPRVTTFVGIRRLRLKECDRVAAMADVLTRFGAAVAVADETFAVTGSRAPFKGGFFETRHDHRIALSIATGATIAADPVTLDDADCADKSYPGFFDIICARI